MSDPFRDYPDWPLRHKLASFCGTIVGSIIGFVLLAVLWLATFWQWLKGK